MHGNYSFIVSIKLRSFTINAYFQQISNPFWQSYSFTDFVISYNTPEHMCDYSWFQARSQRLRLFCISRSQQIVALSKEKNNRKREYHVKCHVL